MPQAEKLRGISRREFLKDSVVLGSSTTALKGLAYAPEAAPADFYVAINGDDQWSGRLASPNAMKTDGPFRTLDRARDATRQLKASGRFNKPLTVMIRVGTYTLRRPFVLRPEDSGTEKYPITYAAYPGEQPVISGGKAITGWKPGRGPLWTAEVPEVKAGVIYFRQLFVEGRRRTRARLPAEGNYDKPGLAVVEDRQDPRNRRAFRFKPGEIRENWSNMEDVEVVILQSWTEARLRIEEIDETTHTVTFTGASWRPLTWSTGYYIENVYEGLNRPGMWYLNRKTGLLSYWPLPGQDVTTAEVVAPVTEELICFQGDVDSEKFVQRITLHGLTFCYSAWALPEKGYAYPQAELSSSAYPGWSYTGGTEIPLPQPTSSRSVPAAIGAEGALYCCLENNEILHLGAWGIELGRGSKYNRIVGNRIHDVGAGGIKIGEAENRENDVEETSDTLISDNILFDGCQVYLGSPAIFVGESSKNHVAHNEIRGGWEWGISVGWNEDYMPPNRARDNVIEYNHLHHLGGSALGTHGAIYTAGISPGTVIRFNLVHHISGGGTGIILDNGSGAILVENNIVYHTDNGGLNTNFNVLGNVIQNNIFALGKNGEWMRYGDPPHMQPPPPNANIVYRNIVYWKEGGLYRDKKWLNFDIVQDYNVYYDASGHPVKFLSYDFKEWKMKGSYLDQHSVIADPLFVDPENGDFTLKPESPALKLGFKPIDIRGAGARGAAG